ncbi:MAG: Sua5 family C-terminal domain-containing protein [Ignavibacteria bacterium]|nr:Sua5 family C-terminal domain-containing protein [Ignavibacteria bacterium]
MTSFCKEKAGHVYFGNKNNNDYKMTESLSSNSNLNEIAINLLEILHRMEDADIDYLVAEPVPEHGIGIAIMDRLRKAAYRFNL